MKAVHFYSFCFVLMAFTAMEAQVGYGNNSYGSNGYGRRNSGINNSNNGSMMSQQPNGMDSQKAAQINIDKIVAKLKTDLTLDDLQVFGITKVITDSNKSREVAMKKKEASQDDLIKELTAISEKTDREINSMLSKEQKVKYKAYIEEVELEQQKKR